MFLNRVPRTILRQSIFAKLYVPGSRTFGIRNWSTFASNDTSLTVHSLNTAFPYIWLRDSCQTTECIHPTTLQKLHRTSDISLDIRPVHDGVQMTSDGVQITWTDGHKSFFDASFLKRHSSPDNLSSFHKDVEQKPWDNAGISKARDLFVPYESLKTPAGLLVAITQISQAGLLFVSGVPNKETSNETCELRTLAQIFGEIRPTFYGLLWDVKNVQNSRNIAYTNLDLGLHMDLLCVSVPKHARATYSTCVICQKDISRTPHDTRFFTAYAIGSKEEHRFSSTHSTLHPLSVIPIPQTLKS